ncbi:unnamed protein product, partial [Scytosiphon promiscuus]
HGRRSGRIATYCRSTPPPCEGLGTTSKSALKLSAAMVLAKEGSAFGPRALRLLSRPTPTAASPTAFPVLPSGSTPAARSIAGISSTAVRSPAHRGSRSSMGIPSIAAQSAATAAAAAAAARDTLISVYTIPSLRFPARSLQGCHRYASTVSSSSSSSSDSSSADGINTASGPAAKRMLYGGHQPTSPLQRTAMAGWAAVTALMEPERADMVAALGEVTGRMALERLYRSMLADPEGREILRARPVINEGTVDLAALAALPEGTFGKSYSNFMEGNKFSPDSRSPVQYVDDPDLAYVMRRYREVHDLWHVLSGLPPTVEGELALKWFELVQTGLPVCALGAVVGPLALPQAGGSGSVSGGKRGSREVLARTYVPWAIRAGRRARKPLVCVWYERRWEQPLEQVRRELGVEAAP